MKKPYSKPRITVETLQLDQPIAAGCNADFDDVRSLMELGFFVDTDSCTTPCPASGPIFPGGNDTICYHSNVQTAFLS